MKIVYLDCFSGISGDMCLGALVDAGLPLPHLKAALKKIPLNGYSLSENRVRRAGIMATRVDVKVNNAISNRLSAFRRWKDIRKIVKESTLPEYIKKQGLAVFKNLFEAEAMVHGKTINTAHLHELGSVDCMVDIFGTLIGLSILGIGKVYASPVNTGSGTVKTEHGTLPVPAPATSELLRGIPCYSSGPAFEMTTPTGAALLRTISSGFGNMPRFIPETTGSGAGGKDPEDHPNLLRMIIGRADKAVHDGRIVVIETNIDDMNPQVYEYVIGRLFEAGALDVFMTQVIMKKGRPGILLSVLCDPVRLHELSDIILGETTTIGLRYYETERIVMNRSTGKVNTRHGSLRTKQSTYGELRRTTPEYEDCLRLARQKNLPLLEVMKEAGTAVRRSR